MLKPAGIAVGLLGTTQTLAWASSYYLPAILAAPIARDLGISVPTVFGAFSAALVVAALIGPHSGEAIDRWGGRPVLMTTNLIFAAGLWALSMATGPITLFAAWALIGVGMGSGLYEAAFAALVRLYGTKARATITGVTLFAGFASTVGWPLSTLLLGDFGWRGTCMTWAVLHLCIGFPLNALLPQPEAALAAATEKATSVLSITQPVGDRTRRTAILLAVVFAATWFVSTAMAAHLPRLLQGAGATVGVALLAGTLVGPAQVAARVLEYTFLRKMHPLLSARIASVMHPAGAVVLGVFGGPAAVVFTVLHGAGNGILTIAKGTLPLVLFGPNGYGRQQGLLAVPARIAQAMAPWIFGLCIDRWGSGSLWISSALGGLSLLALLMIPTATSRPVAPVPSIT